MSPNNKKEPSTESSHQQMLNSAVAYFLAAERCNQPMAFGQYPVHDGGTPVVVLYAFSIELALKVLLKKNAISYSHLRGSQGHSLSKLFELLPQASKDELGYFSMKTHQTSSSDEMCIIDELDSVFQDWRYHFESEYLSVSTTDLNRLFMAVHNEIRVQFPDFISRLELEWGAFKFELLSSNTSLKLVPKVVVGH